MLRAAMSANLVIAAAAVSVVASTALLADRPVPMGASVAAFTSAFAVYNFDRLADKTVNDGSSSPQRAALLRRFRAAVVAAVWVACLVMFGVAISAGFVGALWVLAFPLGGLLYVVPLFAGKRLKDIPYLKSLYVPVCWCTFVGQAASLGSIEFGAELAVFTAFFFLRAFASAAVGDIRDVEADRAAGVQTLIVALGRDRGAHLIAAVHAASISVLVVAASLSLVPAGTTALAIPAMFGYACFCRIAARPERSEFSHDLYDFEVVAYAPMLWLMLP